jgi:prepilin-type processing-associated H-X9-DG protein
MPCYGWNYVALGKRHADRYFLFRTLDTVERPGETLSFADSSRGPGYNHPYLINAWWGGAAPSSRHMGAGNFVFLDNHVERIQEEDFYANEDYFWKARKDRGYSSQW